MLTSDRFLRDLNSCRDLLAQCERCLANNQGPPNLFEVRRSIVLLLGSADFVDASREMRQAIHDLSVACEKLSVRAAPYYRSSSYGVDSDNNLARNASRWEQQEAVIAQLRKENAILRAAAKDFAPVVANGETNDGVLVEPAKKNDGASVVPEQLTSENKDDAPATPVLSATPVPAPSAPPAVSAPSAPSAPAATPAAPTAPATRVAPATSATPAPLTPSAPSATPATPAMLAAPAAQAPSAPSAPSATPAAPAPSAPSATPAIPATSATAASAPSAPSDPSATQAASAPSATPAASAVPVSGDTKKQIDRTGGTGNRSDHPAALDEEGRSRETKGKKRTSAGDGETSSSSQKKAASRPSAAASAAARTAVEKRDAAVSPWDAFRFLKPAEADKVAFFREIVLQKEGNRLLVFGIGVEY